MPRVSPPIDRDELIRLYATGVSLGHLSRQFRTRSTRIRTELEQAGVHVRSRSEQLAMTPPRTVEVDDIDGYVVRYLAGEGLNTLAIDANVAPGTMAKRLRGAGVAIRPRSTEAANVAARGSKRSPATLALRAARNAEALSHVGPHEQTFATLLNDLGCQYIQQHIVGKYNVDFALEAERVAVEVVSGGGNKSVAAGRRERIEYLLDRGWHVVEIMMIGRCRGVVTRAAAEYVIALAKLSRGQPSGQGHHWMIWGDGEAYAARSRHVDKVA